MKCSGCNIEMMNGETVCPKCGYEFHSSAQFQGGADTKIFNRESLWYAILRAVVKVPSVKIDRNSFLIHHFERKCDAEKMDVVLREGTVSAGLSLDMMDWVADEIIKKHTTVTTGAAFLAGLPGGLALAATIPADTAQYYFHAIQLAQKLAYVYGYPNLDDGSDEEFIANMTLFIGAMSGVGAAAKILTASKNEQPQMTLVRTMYYPAIKQAARALGFRLNREIFAKGLGKALPVLGGFVSGAMTWAFFTKESNRLKRQLRKSAAAAKTGGAGR